MTCRAFSILLLLPLAAGCGPRPVEEATLPAPAVEVVAARTGSLPLAATSHGVVRPRDLVQIRPEISAAVAAVLVDTGATVEAGQALVRLQGDRQREQVRQAEAGLMLAQANERQEIARRDELAARLARTRALAEQQLVSVLDLDALVAQHAGAVAAAQSAAAEVERELALVDERRAELDRATVRAPTAGRVGARRAEVGQLVDPSTVLFELGDPDRLLVEIPLTEDLLAQVRVGMPATVRAPGGQPVAATLARISPFLSSQSFRTTGEIDLEDAGGLQPGAFVTVEVQYGESESATLVPTAALWEDPNTGALAIFVVDGGAPATTLETNSRAVERRQIELLAEGQGLVAVSPLAEGELVVINGQHLLVDASDARVREAKWEQVIALQAEPRESMLRRFLERQRQVAASAGAQPPDVATFLAEGRQGGGG